MRGRLALAIIAVSAVLPHGHRTLRAAASSSATTAGPRVLDGAALAGPGRAPARGARRQRLGQDHAAALPVRGAPPRRRPVAVDGRPLEHSRRGLRAHRQEVQLVLQDPDDQLFSASVAQDVSFGPVNLGLPEDDVRARVAEALRLLAVEHLADRPTHQLSYGERKRVAIAGAVAMRPCVLLLDEPTAGLDPSAVGRGPGRARPAAGARTTRW